MIIDKYLNKEVIIEEKRYQVASTIQLKGMNNNRLEGMITNFDENFIELDNNCLINLKHVYRIILK